MAMEEEAPDQVSMSNILAMMNEMRLESKQAFDGFKLRLESVESQQVMGPGARLWTIFSCWVMNSVPCMPTPERNSFTQVGE